MHEPFELFVYNPDIGSHFVTQVQVIDKRNAGLKRLLFEGLFSCENLYKQVGFMNILRGYLNGGYQRCYLRGCFKNK